MKFSIKKKLICSFGTIFFVVSVIGFFLIKGIVDIRKIGEEKSELLELAGKLKELQVVHYRWVDNLGNAIRSGKKFDGVLDPRQCGFGKWYYSYKVQYPELVDKFRAIEVPHENLHQTGAKVVGLMSKGDNIDAEKLFLKIKEEILPALMTVYDPFLSGIDSVYNSLKEKEKNFISARIVFTCLLVIFLLILIVGMVLVLNRIITKPLIKLMEVAKQISEGNLSQKKSEMACSGDDELGELCKIFGRMLDMLNNLVQRAELIANGVIGADKVEEKMKEGMDLAAAAAATGGEGMRGDLSDAFDRMQTELRKLTIQARAIANDDLHNPVLDVQIPGELGEAFHKMVENLKQLAQVAEKIAEGDLSVKIDRQGVLASAFEKVIKSSEELSNTASKIADGDLTTTIKIRSKKDVLANAFAKMVENLRGLVGQISQTANIITNSSQVLAQTSEQATSNTSQLAGVIGQITQSTTSIAHNAQTAASSSQNASELARKGKELAGKLLSRMQTVEMSATKSKESIESLGKRSAKIGEIVNIITKIAEQTNLLSLNAAIEAARAGESGRGFAVVADEIRKLAEHSSASAGEITKLIGEIRQETETAVNLTGQSTKEVAEGGKLVLETDRGLSAIFESVENVSRQIEQIAAASEELAASTQEASASSEEQTGAIEEVSSSAQSLSQTAEELKNLVAKFKV